MDNQFEDRPRALLTPKQVRDAMEWIDSFERWGFPADTIERMRREVLLRRVLRTKERKNRYLDT